MSPKRAWLIAALMTVLAGCTSSSGTSVLAPTATPVTASHTPVPGLVVVHDPGQVTGTLHGPCHVQGQLPDHACTPGAIDTTVTAAKLCAPHYSTAAYRPPEAQTQAFKYDQAYPAYGLGKNVKTELDHLVSLELGGANDATNLWPETPPTPNPKDSVEAVLHAWVCATTGTTAQSRLRQAQLAIAGNWTTAEKVLGVVVPSASPSPAAPLPASSGRLAPTPVRTAQAPARTTPAPPATSVPAPAPVSCYPRTSGGNCYRPGELCRKADHGASGTDASGGAITCRDNGGWRWEAA
jgi:hypothetical protein